MERCLKAGLHPYDDLIRAIIRTGRQATPTEVQQILRHIAGAPFDPRVIAVPSNRRGLTYQGRTLGGYEDALFVHLVQRVVVDEQWADGTTEQEYLDDLHAAAGDPGAQLVLYQRRGGAIAAIFAPNVVPAHRWGRHAEPWLFVVYAADHGTIISGYQVSGLQTLSIPGGAQWLTPRK